MSTTIGNLSVQLSANSSRFSSTLKAARKEIDQVNAAVDRGSRSMKAFYQSQERAASRSFTEQRVRDEMASRIKAMRAATLNEKVKQEASARLFGTAKEIEKQGQKQGQIYGGSVIDGIASAMSVSSMGKVKNSVEDLGKRLDLAWDAADPGPKGVKPDLTGFRTGYYNTPLNKGGDPAKAQRGLDQKLDRNLKLLMGGGILEGARAISMRFNDATKNVEAMVQAMARGEATAEDLAGELLKSIPIAGSLGEGLRRTWDILSGNVEAIERMKQAAKETNMVSDAMAAKMNAVRQSTQDAADQMEEMRREFARMKLEGTGLKFFEVDAETMDRVRGYRDNAESRKKAADLEKSRAELKQLQDLRANVPASLTKTIYEGQGQAMFASEVQVDNPRYAELTKSIESVRKRIAEAEAEIDKNTTASVEEAERLRWAKKIQIAKEGAAGWANTVVEGMRAPLAEAWKRFEDASKERASFLADLKREWEQFDWSESDKKLDAFKRQFAPSDAELERAKELFDMIEMADEQKKFLDGLNNVDDEQPHRFDSKERLSTIDRKFTANIPREAFINDQKMLRAAEKTAKATSGMDNKMKDVVKNLSSEVVDF